MLTLTYLFIKECKCWLFTDFIVCGLIFQKILMGCSCNFIYFIITFGKQPCMNCTQAYISTYSLNWQCWLLSVMNPASRKDSCKYWAVISSHWVLITGVSVGLLRHYCKHVKTSWNHSVWCFLLPSVPFRRTSLPLSIFVFLHSIISIKKRKWQLYFHSNQVMRTKRLTKQSATIRKYHNTEEVHVLWMHHATGSVSGIFS